VGSWDEIGSEGSVGEGSIGKVGIGEGGIGKGGSVGKGGIGKGGGIGGESSGGDDGSGLGACGWLGVREVGSKDLRCMDRGIHFITGVGVSEGGSYESDDGGDGKTGLGGL